MAASSPHDHYHQPDLTARILAALRDAGLDADHLTRDDLDLLDEFHIRGRAATRELAALADLRPGLTVLDLGCGLGGPARLLADEFGCRVTGLDLVPEYCAAAAELTRRTGLADLVTFRQGDMGDLPFADGSFDRVWSQHTQMNIADKAALAAEAVRVLRPGGKAVFYEVCAGNGGPIHLPVPWASVPEHSHLCGAGAWRDLLAAAGLRECSWADVTEAAMAWIDGLAAGPGAAPAAPSPAGRPGLGLVMGPQAGAKSRNLARNLREGRVVVVQGVFAR